MSAKKIIIENILTEYTKWLCDNGYTDADVYAEEPKAVDRFLKEKRNVIAQNIKKL